MQQVTTIELKRDCPAIQIPVGNEVTLKAHTPVDVVQTLGGTYTVHTMGGLFRIAGTDSDALGMAAPAGPLTEVAVAAGAPTEKLVWDVLRTCFDPEIPVNIVDLGLVYDVAIDKAPEGGQRVAVKLTLTAPGCGMGTAIAGDAQQKLLAVPGIEDASVEVVWDPPWHQSMITAEGRKVLGIEG